MGRFGVPVTGDRTIIQNSRGPLRDGLATKDGMPVLPNGFQAAILLVVVALAVRCQISMLNYGFWQDDGRVEDDGGGPPSLYRHL